MHVYRYPLFWGIGLLLVIGIPSFVPALHTLFHYHSHLRCTATGSEVHLHAQLYDCDLCDYLTKITFFYDHSQSLEEHQDPVVVTPINRHEETFFSYRITHLLRGPPAV